MKRISIIVPVFNAEQFLDDCITSILAQTYHNFELILVDDGSTDSSGKICRHYELQDRRIKYIYKPNAGVSSARNEGIRIAQGEYLLFVDSDDTVKENILRILLDPCVDFSMCGYELVNDAHNEVTCAYVCPQLYGTTRELAAGIEDYLSPPYLLGPCFKLFKKSIIDLYGIQFPPELSYGEDAVFVFEYLSHCTTVAIHPYNGYSYRKHGNETLSGKFLRDKIDINYRINALINQFLQQECIEGREQVVSNHLLECMVSYEKELIRAFLPFKSKYHLFYQKYEQYKDRFGKPKRLAQKIVIWAGKCKLFYPIVYLFKMRG